MIAGGSLEDFPAWVVEFGTTASCEFFAIPIFVAMSFECSIVLQQHSFPALCRSKGAFEGNEPDQVIRGLAVCCIPFVT